MYDGYKANRHGMPPELAQQLPVLKELLVALGYKIISLEDMYKMFHIKQGFLLVRISC